MAQAGGREGGERERERGGSRQTEQVSGQAARTITAMLNEHYAPSVTSWFAGCLNPAHNSLLFSRLIILSGATRTSLLGEL